MWKHEKALEAIAYAWRMMVMVMMGLMLNCRIGLYLHDFIDGLYHY